MGRRKEFETAGLPPFEDAYYGDATVHHLPIEAIEPYMDPSASQNKRKVAGIAAHLKKGKAIREPIHLISEGGRPFLWDGHHRLLAAKRAGHTTIPAKVTL